MKNEVFEELLQSVREMGSISRGEAQPARVTDLSTPNVKQVSGKSDFSQLHSAMANRVAAKTRGDCGAAEISRNVSDRDLRVDEAESAV